MVLVATLLIISATMAVILWPLFRARPAPDTGQSWERDRLDSLLSRRDSAYDAIRDLDFEYRLGNLSEADYLELRERYRERAAGVLRRLERLDSSSPASEVEGQPVEIEHER